MLYVFRVVHQYKVPFRGLFSSPQDHSALGRSGSSSNHRQETSTLTGILSRNNVSIPVTITIPIILGMTSGRHREVTVLGPSVH